MKLADINALRELDRGEVIDRLRELGATVTGLDRHSTFPTTDALRLLVVEHTIERELADKPDAGAGSQTGAAHFAEAVKVHAHAVQLGREVEAKLARNDYSHVDTLERRARLHFDAARSAAAIAQVGITTGVLEAVGQMLEGID